MAFLDIPLAWLGGQHKIRGGVHPEPRKAATADRPWVRSDTEAPTFDEAKARIEWEAAQAARGADTDPPSAPAPSDSPSSPTGQDAETVAAQLELEERQRESAARLDAIRAELGIEPDDKAGG